MRPVVMKKISAVAALFVLLFFVQLDNVHGTSTTTVCAEFQCPDPPTSTTIPIITSTSTTTWPTTTTTSVPTTTSTTSAPSTSTTSSLPADDYGNSCSDPNIGVLDLNDSVSGLINYDNDHDFFSLHAIIS